MEKYGNFSGNSGVQFYKIAEDCIYVVFAEGSQIYKYSFRSAGITHVETMKSLAERGRGLSAYISRHVKSKYEKLE